MSRTPLLEARQDGLRIAHRPDFRPEWVAQAIELHRGSAARGREHCEHWGPGSSVSRVILRGAVDFDLAVKWNHDRGLRGALSDALHGSRAARAAAGADVLASLGMAPPETLAFAERRRLGVPFESFLITGFLADTEPLPVAMAGMRLAPERRRALARAVGHCIGSLHGAGYDHADLKHSNLLVGRDGRVVLLDLDTLVPRTRPTFRRVVRALGQLEAYTRDLYPWVPRSDRARFLRAYFEASPEFAARRDELLREVEAWVAERLARWEGRDRELHIYYPLAPRDTRPLTVATARGSRPASGAPRL
ncbi:MAG: lipopolysaccharide kinase InaA family protein [Myxococcota bacterium]